MSRESDFYGANVALQLERRMVFLAALAVQVAQVESRDFPDLELDAVPPMRRLNFQSAQLFATYPGGAKVICEPHSGGSHVAVVSGEVTITSLTRSRMPRSVLTLQPYQETLASVAQLALFESGIEKEEASRLWALLIYGGDYRSPKLTLCRMTFPTPEGKFAPGTIDLADKHRDVIELFDNVEFAKQQIVEFLEMRKQRRA